MKNKKIIIAAAALIALLAVAAVILLLAGKKDAYRVIKVNSFEGSVAYERNGRSDQVFRDMNLQSGDVVTVGSDSLLELIADSDKHIAAEADTCFSLEASGSPKAGKIRIIMRYGTALYTIDRKLSADSSFEVETSNATLSVRGTVFRVAYDQYADSTRLDVIEGTVHVKADAQEREVGAGESVIITDEITDTQPRAEDGAGGNADGSDAGAGNTDGGGAGQTSDGKLGFRNIHYPALNPNWTDTDHLALIDTESWNDGRGVFVLDFGKGSNITKEAGIRDIHENNSYGVFGSVFQNTGDLFYLTYMYGDSLELVIVKPDMWVTIGIESDDEMYYDEETSQVVSASNGHYDIVMPEDEYDIGQQFCAVIYPTNGSWPMAVKIRGVGTLEKAEEYFAYIEAHMGNYRLSEKYNLATAQDKNGNAVDLSSYAFYTDLLALDVAERFGMNFKETPKIKYISRNALMVKGSDGNWREVQFTDYISLSEDDKAVDFMGYEMYYLSKRYIYLKYAEKQYIRIDIRHSIDSEQERKEWLEREYFGGYVSEN